MTPMTRMLWVLASITFWAVVFLPLYLPTVR